MNTIKINKAQLISAIAASSADFGDAFLSICVSLNGDIECKQPSHSDLVIMALSGMGEFSDSDCNYYDNDNYDAWGVAKYIVEDGSCLNLTAETIDAVSYEFKIVESSISECMHHFAQSLPPSNARAQCYTIGSYRLNGMSWAEKLLSDHGGAIYYAYRAAQLMVWAGCATAENSKGDMGIITFRDGSKIK